MEADRDVNRAGARWPEAVAWRPMEGAARRRSRWREGGRPWCSDWRARGRDQHVDEASTRGPEAEVRKLRDRATWRLTGAAAWGSRQGGRTEEARSSHSPRCTGALGCARGPEVVVWRPTNARARPV